MRSILLLSLLTLSTSAVAHDLSVEGAPHLPRSFASSQKFVVPTEFPKDVSVVEQHCPHHASHSTEHHRMKHVSKPVPFGNNFHNILTISPQRNSGRAIHKFHKHHHQGRSKEYFKN